MPLRRSYDSPPLPDSGLQQFPDRHPFYTTAPTAAILAAWPGRRRPHRNPVRHAHRRPRWSATTVRLGQLPCGEDATPARRPRFAIRPRREHGVDCHGTEAAPAYRFLNEPRTRSRRWSHSPRLPITLRHPSPSDRVSPRVGLRPDHKAPGSMNGVEGFPNLRQFLASRAVALGESLPITGKLVGHRCRPPPGTRISPATLSMYRLSSGCLQ